MIKALVRMFLALNSNARKEQMAAGFACGVLLALVPSGNLLWILLFALVFFTKINYGMQLLVMGIFKLLGPLTARGLDALGWTVLNAPPLQGFFTRLYNLPLAPLTRFNNTIVIGGLLAGLVLWLPLFFAMRAFIAFYRAKLAPRIIESKAYKAFLKLPLINSLVKAVSLATNVAGTME